VLATGCAQAFRGNPSANCASLCTNERHFARHIKLVAAHRCSRDGRITNERINRAPLFSNNRHEINYVNV
jgi:hypothetical protein